jgi:hypothetical protein
LEEPRYVSRIQGTDDLVKALNKLDDAPWAEIKNGHPLDSRELAKGLRKYDIHNKPVRIAGVVVSSYTAESFWDAWTRYLVSDVADPTNEARQGSERPPPAALCIDGVRLGETNEQEADRNEKGKTPTVAGGRGRRSGPDFRPYHLSGCQTTLGGSYGS